MPDETSECLSCFNSSKFPGVQINQEGLCHVCSHPPKEDPQRAKTKSNLSELRRIAEKLKTERRGKYDCIIGASGGLDSFYVLYIAKRLLDLNPLVVSYDSGFMYPEAKQNLHKLATRLNVDLRVISSAAKNDWKYLRSTIRALEPLDAYWGICLFCSYVLSATIYSTAIQEKISTILVSSNSYESVRSVPDGFRGNFMMRSLWNRGLWIVPKVAFHLAVAQYHLLKLKLEFYVPPIVNLLRRSPLAQGMNRLNVTDYVPWNVEEMVRTLGEEADWKAPRPELPMRFDCLLEEGFVNHTYQRALGCSIHGIICNNLIHAGVRTKSRLRETLEEIDSSTEECIIEARKRLGLE